MPNPATVKVVLLCSFAQPNWAMERGEVMEVPVEEARRMIGRGLAKLPDKAPQLPEPTPAEAAAAKVMHVEVADQITEGCLEKSVRVRPARSPREVARERAARQASQRISQPGRVEDE